MNFEEWFKKTSSWGLSRNELVSASFNTPGSDAGDVVYTSPSGSAMTRHICSHWIDFHDAAKMGWDAHGALTVATLADEFKKEDEALRRRMVHHTRQRGDMTIAQAIDLHQRMEGTGS